MTDQTINSKDIKCIFFSAVFVVQFLLLSVCFGIPLMTFFMSTGQYLGSGLIDMWRISPIFQVKLSPKTTALLSLFHKNLGLHIPASWMTENEKWNHLTERSKFLRVPAEEINQCKIICVQKYACSELLMLYFRLCGRFFKASDCDQFEIIIAKICK